MKHGTRSQNALRVQPVFSCTRAIRPRKLDAAPGKGKVAKEHQKAAVSAFTQEGVLRSLLVSPEGSGKSWIMQATGYHWLLQNYKVLILVPQNSIKGGFDHPSTFKMGGKTIKWPGSASSHMDWSEAEGPALEELLDTPPHLHPRGRVWVCTYNALNGLMESGFKDHYLKNLFVILDEGHHIAADINRSGTFLRLLLDNDVPHTLGTATPFRTDKARIIPRSVGDSYIKHIRERSEHLADMRYITGLNTRVLVGTVIDSLDQEFERIKREGRKAIVKLPSVGGKHSERLFRQINAEIKKKTKTKSRSKYLFEAAFIHLAKKHGLTYISVATPESNAENEETLKNLLDRVRENASAHKEVPDVTFVQERYLEGSDCVVWTDAIQIGISGSPVVLRQFPGRTLRDHSTKRGKMAEFVTLVPEFGEDRAERVEWARTIIKRLVTLSFLNCEYAADYTLSQPGEESGPSGPSGRKRLGDFDVNDLEQGTDYMFQGKTHPAQRSALKALAAGMDPDKVREVAEEELGKEHKALGEYRPSMPMLDIDLLTDQEVLDLSQRLLIQMGKLVSSDMARDLASTLNGRSEVARKKNAIRLYRDKGMSLMDAAFNSNYDSAKLKADLEEQGLIREEDSYRVVKAAPRRRKRRQAIPATL